MGGAEGAAAAQRDLARLKESFPDAIVAQQAKELGIYRQVVGEAKPMFRDRAIEEYKKRHKWKTAIFGVSRTFLNNLDTRLGHAGDPREEASVDLRDESGNPAP